MKIIYRKQWEDDDLSEIESFHDVCEGNLVLIEAWCLSDAMYRHKYMKRLFSYLNVEIKDLPKKYTTKARLQIKNYLGL